MTHQVLTIEAHLLPRLECRYTALPQHAVHHLQPAQLCHACVIMLSTAVLVDAQCCAVPCQILPMVSCCKLDLAVSQLTASFCLQSLACCSTDTHTACRQVEGHEDCCTSPVDCNTFQVAKAARLDPRLHVKMSQLHERLDKTEDCLLEKHLILEEIASLSHRLRNQAADGREDTLELAQKVSNSAYSSLVMCCC